MFIPFFLELKAARVPVSLREYLTLLEGMDAGLVQYDVEGFYYLARAALVKDERHIDRFDQVFAHVFKGIEALSGESAVDVANIVVWETLFPLLLDFGNKTYTGAPVIGLEESCCC